MNRITTEEAPPPFGESDGIKWGQHGALLMEDISAENELLAGFIQRAAQDGFTHYHAFIDSGCLYFSAGREIN